MECLKNENGKELVLALAAAIEKNKEYLSEIDGAVGDGDHGINMHKGFSMAAERMEDDMTIDQALRALGSTLLNDIGGSMGPIYGSFFMSLFRRMKGQEIIDQSMILEALETAVGKISDLAGAKKGDKTILDTLVPAVEAYRSVMEREGSFRESLVEMEKAAQAGMESTKDLVAKFGRASRLGERSRGHIDAGAASCHIILRTMAETMMSRM